jgi:hypothetical protein
MSSLALTVMIVICGIVWGGFVVLLTRAFRREGAKQKSG